MVLCPMYLLITHIFIGKYRMSRRSKKSDVENGEYEEDRGEEMQANTSIVCFVVVVVVVVVVAVIVMLHKQVIVI